MRLLKGILFKGKKYKYIHTRDILLRDLREVFFPRTFQEVYRYLGSVPYREDSKVFDAMLPLVLTMDYLAKPKWCPRWILRLLHLFGNDNSIVRVRNWRLHNLFRKLTKGIIIVDYKLKWSEYDLRISIHGNELLQNLAEDIETSFYKKGRRNFLLDQLEAIPEAEGRYVKWSSTSELENLYSSLIESDKL